MIHVCVDDYLDPYPNVGPFHKSNVMLFLTRVWFISFPKRIWPQAQWHDFIINLRSFQFKFQLNYWVLYYPIDRNRFIRSGPTLWPQRKTIFSWYPTSPSPFLFKSIKNTILLLQPSLYPFAKWNFINFLHFYAFFYQLCTFFSKSLCQTVCPTSSWCIPLAWRHLDKGSFGLWREHCIELIGLSPYLPNITSASKLAILTQN